MFLGRRRKARKPRIATSYEKNKTKALPLEERIKIVSLSSENRRRYKRNLIFYGVMLIAIIVAIIYLRVYKPEIKFKKIDPTKVEKFDKK